MKLESFHASSTSQINSFSDGNIKILKKIYLDYYYWDDVPSKFTNYYYYVLTSAIIRFTKSFYTYLFVFILKSSVFVGCIEALNDYTVHSYRRIGMERRWYAHRGVAVNALASRSEVSTNKPVFNS